MKIDPAKSILFIFTQSKYAKYLIVTLTYNLNFDKHVENSLKTELNGRKYFAAKAKRIIRERKTSMLIPER